MRIIGGTHRSRRIDAPKDLPLRPTTDFARESLFNILNHRLNFEGLKVLDLFCGTGAISFEFASHGAEEIISVDINDRGNQFIKMKAKEFGFTSIRPVRMDALKFLDVNTLQFDLIFADPPYEYPKYEQLIQKVLAGNALKPNGLFIVEHDSRTHFPEEERFLEKRTYGAVNFSFYQQKEHA